MSIVEQATKATAKRVTYGIEIKAGSFTLNEWGLHESQAKEVNEMLVLNGDKSFTIDGLTFSRRAPSELSAKLAAMKAQLTAQG
jgi:hypothetical protein